MHFANKVGLLLAQSTMHLLFTILDTVVFLSSRKSTTHALPVSISRALCRGFRITSDSSASVASARRETVD
jgi:hypothetical protein